MTIRTQFERGFSLIEVLLAVAILSFGLLALASLQSSITRSSTETKARSVALSIAKDRIEELRGFTSISGYLNDVVDTAATAVNDSSGSLGGVNYTVTTAVTRYAFNTDPDGDPATSDGAFEAVTNETAALGSDYTSENEFKRVEVTVAWTDSDGVSRSVVLEDAIGSVSPTNTGRVPRNSSSTANRGPKVLINDPSTQSGVIPIAIGDGSETAATNPRPEISGNSDTSLQETAFDIYTYATLQGVTTAQSRVETALVGCKCDTDNAPTSTPYRPTYWNGIRYVVPDEASYTALAGQADLGNGANADAQSELCTQCCRDHQDPATATGAKFSPRRSNHYHYDWDPATGELVDSNNDGSPDVVTTGTYREVCRMIRVDGIYRVAADMYNEYFNLLKTADDFESSAPDTTAAGSYEDFVIAYINQQMVGSSGADYNTQLTQTEADTLAANASHNINAPTLTVDEDVERWMHGRGLYIDYLEADARDALDEAQDEGCGTYTTDTADHDIGDPIPDLECVLRVLPFTSINLTEIAYWRPALSSDSGFQNIVVANGDFSTAASSSDPVRGRSTTKSGGDATITSYMRNSNAGLIANGSFKIYPDAEDASNTQPETDTQAVTVVGGTSSNITGNAGPNNTALVTGTKTPAENYPSSFTKIYLTVEALSGNALAYKATNITLTGPSGSNCSFSVLAASGNNNATTWEQSWIFSATDGGASCDTSVAGAWTLSVGNDSSQQKAVSMTWSLTLGPLFQVNLNPYTFSTAAPSVIGSPSITCNATNNTNPYECVSTDYGAGHTITVGNYNYSTTKTNQSITCNRTDDVGSQTCTGKTLVYCKNFTVDSATLTQSGGGTVAGTDKTQTGTDGKSSEATTFTFSAVNYGDSITIATSAGTDTAPTCTYSGNKNNNQVCGNGTGLANAATLSNACN